MCSLLNFKWWKWSADQNFSKQWAFCDEQMFDLRNEKQEKKGVVILTDTSWVFIPYLLATLFYLFFGDCNWLLLFFLFCSHPLLPLHLLTVQILLSFLKNLTPFYFHHWTWRMQQTSYRSINHSHIFTTPIKSNFKISF